LEQLVTIELFGRPYTFKTSSEGIQAQEVADFLAREVAKIQSQQIGSVSEMNKLTIVIVAALNIASAHFEYKAIKSGLMQDLSIRSENVIRLLDDGLTRFGSGPSDPSGA